MGYGNGANGSAKKKNSYIFPGLGRSGHIYLRQLQGKIDANTYPLAWEIPAGIKGIKGCPYLNITNKIDGSLVCRLELADYGRDLKVGLDYTDFLEQTNEYLRMSVVGYIEMVECLVREAGDLAYDVLKMAKKEPIIP